MLARFDVVPIVANAEALRLVEDRRLMGQGVGWIDIHLLASSLVARAQLWSLDRRIASIARNLASRSGADATGGSRVNLRLGFRRVW